SATLRTTPSPKHQPKPPPTALFVAIRRRTKRQNSHLSGLRGKTSSIHLSRRLAGALENTTRIRPGSAAIPRKAYRKGRASVNRARRRGRRGRPLLLARNSTFSRPAGGRGGALVAVRRHPRARAEPACVVAQLPLGDGG